MSYYYDDAFKASTFLCEECVSSVSYDGNWVDSRKKAKKDGWLIKIRNKKFLHFCSKECWKRYLEKRSW